MPLLIGFGHQALFAVDVVGGSAVLPLPDGLGNPSPKGVMPVVGFDLRLALALLCAGIPDQPFGCVVFVFFALERVAFLALAAVAQAPAAPNASNTPKPALCACPRRI